MSYVPRSVAIVGAAGKVGFATASALRETGVEVTAVLRNASKGAQLTAIGCEIVGADILDSEALAKAVHGADAVQIIVPPRHSAPDTAQEMRAMIESLGKALETASPKRVLAISDYGAHISRDIGMPTLFRSVEERLAVYKGHTIILRSAEHMQGWGRAIPGAVASGTLKSFHDPLHLPFPTISAPDLGKIAADLLMRPASETGMEVFHAEGPRRYSAHDVGSALTTLLGRTIEVQAVPRSMWEGAFRRVMSESLADLLIKANDAQNEGGVVDVEPGAAPLRGTTELIDALRPLVLA